MLSFPRGVDPSDGLHFYADFANPDCMAGYETSFFDLGPTRIAFNNTNGYTYNNSAIKSVGLSGGQRFNLPAAAFRYGALPVTVSCVCSFRSGANATVFMIGTTSTNQAQGLGLSSSQIAYFGGGTTVVLGPAVEYGKWYHITGTSNGTLLRLYVNGILVNTSTLGSYGISSGAALIGVNLSLANQFVGEIQDVRLYYKTLSDHEVLQSYYKKIAMMP